MFNSLNTKRLIMRWSFEDIQYLILFEINFFNFDFKLIAFINPFKNIS